METRDCPHCVGTGSIPDLRYGNRGKGSWRKRLSEIQVQGIYESQDRVRVVCLQYGISNSTYYAIKSLKHWSKYKEDHIEQ